MQHLFILNSFAGTKDSTAFLKEKIEKLDLKDDYFVEYTRCHGDAKRIAEQYVSRTDDFVRVYACGGDGTANEALSGMIGHDNCALGVIPVGTGNDFVRSLGADFDDFLDLKKMINGGYKKIDLLECNGKYALNVISVGYDCAVADQAQKFKRLPLMSGNLAYKLSILYCLLSKRKHTFVPYADNKKIELQKGYKTQLLAVAGNGKFYGGGIKATPYACLDDGNIDFMSIPTVSVIKFIGLLGSFCKGEHLSNKKADFIIHKKCKKLQLKDDMPINIGIDGEILSMKDPTITIKPKAFCVIVPA